MNVRHIAPLAATFAALLSSPIAPSVAAPAASPATTMMAGTVNAASDTSITVQPGYDTPVTYQLSPTVTVLIDGKSAKTTDLKPGFPANLSISGGVVTAIYARTPNHDAWGNVSTIDSVTITLSDKDGNLSAFTLAPATKATLYGKAGALTDVKTGMYVHIVYGDDNGAQSVEAVRRDTQSFKGKVTSISATSITVTPPDPTAQPSTLTIDSTTTVTIDDQPGTAVKIRKGQFGEITSIDGKLATTITIHTKPGPGPGKHA